MVSYILLFALNIFFFFSFPHLIRTDFFIIKQPRSSHLTIQCSRLNHSGNRPEILSHARYALSEKEKEAEEVYKLTRG